mgnify:CR=1 FL=1
MKTEKIPAILRRVFQALFLAVAGIILLANMYCLAAKEIFKVKAPTVFGYSSAVVLTGSMSGTLEPDDLIVTHKQSVYNVGDIVMYHTSGTPVTHRIISQNEKGYRTKGDANDAEDGGLVHYKNVIGTPVFTIPKLGYFASYIQNPPGTYAALSVGAIILLLIFIPDLFSSDDKDGKEKKKEKKEKVRDDGDDSPQN